MDKVRRKENKILRAAGDDTLGTRYDWLRHPEWSPKTGERLRPCGTAA